MNVNECDIFSDNDDMFHDDLKIFAYKEEVKMMNVFRAPDVKMGKLTALPLKNDIKIFHLFAEIMMLPRRGFSTRSVHQGTVIDYPQ